MRLLLCLMFALLLAACTPEEPRFDASTEEAFQASTKLVRDSMPETRHPALQQALMQLTFQSMMGDNPNLLKLAAAAKTPGSFLGQLAPIVNGRTGEEVIAIAADMKQKRAERQLAAVNSEIQTLELQLQEAQSKHQEERKTLDRIVIDGARYYWSKGQFRDEAVIAFKITNSAEVAIAKIVLHGLLESPGRSVPWVKDSFSYEIKGGLEPGEAQELALAPNIFGSWSEASLKDRSDLVLTLSLPGITDANGNEIGSTSNRNIERIGERLATLRKQRTELGQ
ncbi:MAG: hypothetical protein KJ622_11515 [Alphaproteobacteria bacterium]|nr:hypothetical protein [Alphaproteobacteria bacterium]